MLLGGIERQIFGTASSLCLTANEIGRAYIFVHVREQGTTENICIQERNYRARGTA
jgi:hypothetical protein